MKNYFLVIALLTTSVAWASEDNSHEITRFKKGFLLKGGCFVGYCMLKKKSFEVCCFDENLDQFFLKELEGGSPHYGIVDYRQNQIGRSYRVFIPEIDFDEEKKIKLLGLMKILKCEVGKIKRGQ